MWDSARKLQSHKVKINSNTPKFTRIRHREDYNEMLKQSSLYLSKNGIKIKEAIPSGRKEDYGKIKKPSNDSLDRLFF